MELASAILIEHTAGKLLDRIGEAFREKVIERWSRRRAEVFFEEFCARVALLRNVTMPADLEAALARILDDETSSEILFDAYRRVSLAKSRLLGPRIVALLTAELVVAGRMASLAEEAMFLAAEELTDIELNDFADFVRYWQNKTKSVTDSGLRIEWRKEQFDSSSRQTTPVSTAPINLSDALGSWAVKLNSFGIIEHDLEERQFKYKSDLEDHYIGEGIVREITWWLDVPATYFELVDLIERANSTANRSGLHHNIEGFAAAHSPRPNSSQQPTRGRSQARRFRASCFVGSGVSSAGT